jgi:hypothetical protein
VQTNQHESVLVKKLVKGVSEKLGSAESIVARRRLVHNTKADDC